MPAVQMPDGAIVDLPDNPSPELKAAIQAKVELFHLEQMRAEKFSTAQANFRAANNGAEPPSYLGFPDKDALDAAIIQRRDKLAWAKAQNGDLLDKAAYYAKFGLGKLTQGAASLPTLLADLNLFDEQGQPVKGMPFSQAVSEATQSPQTTGQHYAGATLQGVGGALAGPGAAAAPVRTAVVGASSGAGSEAAAQAFGDTLLSRLLGGLAGGVTAGLATAPKTTRAELVREATRDASEASMRTAQELMRRGLEQGITLNLSQAMPKPSNIDEMVNTLAQSRHGYEVTRTLRTQPTDVGMAIDRELSNLPGVSRPPQLVANNVQEAATSALNSLKEQRTALWQQTLQRGIQAVEDSKQPAIQQAGLDLQAAQVARQALEKQLPQLKQALEAAKSSDALAITAANQKIQDVLAKIQALETFTLPRGRTASNRGTLLEPSARGASIDMDQITRQVQASRLRDSIPPQIAPAVSLSTLQLQNQLKALEAQISKSTSTEQAAQSALTTAQNSVKQATQVPPEAVLQEIQRLRTVGQGELVNTPKGKALVDLADSMLTENGAPITNAQNLNELLKAAGAKLKGVNIDTPGLDAGATKFIQSQINTSRKNLGDAFHPIKDANSAYATFTDSVYNPVKQSVVGRVAGKGFDPAIESAQSRVFGVLEKGTTPGASTSEILTLEKALRKQPNGPQAFQDAVKTWMSNKISEATAHKGGRPSEASAANLEKIFMGNEVKAQGFKDMLVGLARSQGLKDDALLNGMRNVMQIVSAAARRPGTVSGVTAQGLEQASRSPVFGGIGNFSAVQPIRQPFKAIDNALNADAYGFMDRLLTSPEGVDTLIKLGRQPVMSKAAADTLSTFLATTSLAQGGGQSVQKTGQ